ncbi:hypothetical protein SNE40_015611 [Patella caerulea]|uniref:MAM domain-containing protein n=1 Tax=Patella caerulea TaxID=87958 RepID=A0AAN8JG26_PATCE
MKVQMVILLTLIALGDNNVIVDVEMETKIGQNIPTVNNDIDCTFDESYCGWKQATDDKFDWARQNGRTETLSTGPINDHTGGDGSYMYMEASIPQKPNHKARLESPEIFSSTSTPQCLSFWYHMYGKDIAQLNVYMKTAGALGDALWTRSGEEGDIWKRGVLTVDIGETSRSVVFEGVVGDGEVGDIAIDDVSLVEGECPDIGCNFDENICAWKQLKDDDFDWTRNEGKTPTNDTGPTADIKGDGFYMYIDASADPKFENATARLESQEIVSPAPEQCVSFWYHMYVGDGAQLNVYIKTAGALGNALWTKRGDQGDVWKQCYVQVPVGSSPYSVVFEGVKSGSNEGDIAIDDVTFVEGECPGNDCDFEKDYCAWTQWKNDDFDWARNIDGTQTTRTGPTADRTGGGSYMYLEGSFPRTENETAYLESKELMPTTPLCLSFWYHMNGRDIGSLILYKKTRELEKLWITTGDKGDFWRQGYVDLPQGARYTIVIQGIRGSGARSDIAIDDITFDDGECPASLF